jgi:hypothetical protein
MQKKVHRLCGQVVRVPGYTTEMNCASCEVRTEFICYVEESRPPLWSHRVPGYRSRGPGSTTGAAKFSDK